MTVPHGADGEQASTERASLGQTDEVVVSGFGGQGVLFAGQVLAHAALASGKEVTWLPSYGPEMRGGTAHCTVVIADEPIGSPVAERPGYVLALNRPSVERFAPLVGAGGILFFNASFVPPLAGRVDMRCVGVPATQIAAALGNPLAANMVLLGALLGATQLLPLDGVIAALREHLPARHHDLLDVNEAALRRGASGTYIQKEG